MNVSNRRRAATGSAGFPLRRPARCRCPAHRGGFCRRAQRHHRLGVRRAPVAADRGAGPPHRAQRARRARGGKACGADLDAAAAVLSSLAPGKGRGLRLRLPLADGAVTLIDESYNANPASMRAALALLARAELGRGASPNCGTRRYAGAGRQRECPASRPRRGHGCGRSRRLYACGMMCELCERCRVAAAAPAEPRAIGRAVSARR